MPLILHQMHPLVWKRSQSRCKKCKQWRKVGRDMVWGSGHDPCIQNLPGDVWGCCGHGETPSFWLPGYVAGTTLKTFRFSGRVPGNLIRRAVVRVSSGFSLPMWGVFDKQESMRAVRRAVRLRVR